MDTFHKGIKLNIKDGKVGEGVPFERIRRITGYLVGDLERWNNAKRAEEKDRVKHLNIGKK
jgi:anaerobic ribonucleoside-triphosphate reductase